MIQNAFKIVILQNLGTSLRDLVDKIWLMVVLEDNRNVLDVLDDTGILTLTLAE